jgi:hypothetical protein
VPDFSDRLYDRLQSLVNTWDGHSMTVDELPKFIRDYTDLMSEAYDDGHIVVYIGIQMDNGPGEEFTMRIDYQKGGCYT